MLGMREGDASYLSVYASCAFDSSLASGVRRKFEQDDSVQAEGISRLLFDNAEDSLTVD